jgi:hypothetical protein
MRNPLLAFALLIASSLPASAQDRSQEKGAAAKTAAVKSAVEKDPPRERVSGVILKVEKIPADRATTDSAPAAEKGNTNTKTENGKSRPVTLRLTINTDAVWRDWVRDQAKVKDTGPPRKDAEAGAKSVATKGQPADANSKVIVDVTMDSKVETRFRTPEDSTSRGYKTPEEARSGSGTSTVTKTQTAKPVQFTRDDLKTGLFVETDFQNRDGKNKSSIVTVIRPITATEATKKK